MRNLAKHLYRANTHISRVNPRIAWESLRGQAITAPTIDRFSFERSVPSFRHLLVSFFHSFFLFLTRFSYLRGSTTNTTHERVNLSRLYSDITFTFYFYNSSTTLNTPGFRLRTFLFRYYSFDYKIKNHFLEHFLRRVASSANNCFSIEHY